MSITRTSADGPHLPAKQSSGLTEDQTEAFLTCLELGMSVPKIVKTMELDKPAAKRMRRRLHKALETDTKLQARIAGRAQAKMAEGILPATAALTRRAAKGRPDAIKLLFEASGFHNPKVKHEHSGKIEVNLNMPRPQMPKPEDDEEIVDAETVDD